MRGTVGRVGDHPLACTRAGLDRSDELVSEDERLPQHGVADRALDEPVPVRSTEPDRGHPEEHLAVAGSGLRLVVQSKVAGAVEAERLHTGVLAVVRRRPVLAREVPQEQLVRDRSGAGAQLLGPERRGRDRLERDRVLDRLGGAGSPREWRVRGDHHRRHLQRLGDRAWRTSRRSRRP